LALVLLAVGAYQSLASLGWTELMARRLRDPGCGRHRLQPSHGGRQGENKRRIVFVGSGRTSPVATKDVAEVVASVLLDPLQHVGKIYELTGPRSQDLYALAAEYSAALGRSVT
jgi:hypothetical protein